MKSHGILAFGLALAMFALGLVAVATANAGRPIGGQFITPPARVVLLQVGKQILPVPVTDVCSTQVEMLTSAADRTNGQYEPVGALEGQSAKALLVNLEAPASIINGAERVEVYRTSAVDGRPAFVVIVYDSGGCGIGVAVIVKPVK